jgi:hypothetical protein
VCWDTLRQISIFLHLVGSVGHIVHSDAFGSQNTDTLFFMPKWAQCGFHKKHVGTRYAKLVFLHSMGSTCHVMHSLCPGRENLVHYFSCSCGLGTDSIKSVLGHVTPNFCFFLHPVGSAGHSAFWCVWVTKYRCSIFHAPVGLVRFS